MRGGRLVAAGAVALSALALCQTAPPGAKRPGLEPPVPTPRVVIVCWDGAKPSALRQLLREGRLPALKGLLAEGSWSWDGRTILPSSTLPSHVSMLTGVTPDVHGVTWNSDKPEKGPLAAETVFSLAKAHGFRTAMVVGKAKLRLLDRPGSLDADLLETGPPVAVTAGAVEILRRINPSLLFLHFAAPDASGHDWGWGDEAKAIPPSREYVAALVECDRALHGLLAALRKDGRWKDTLLILTADHGGHGLNHGTDDLQDVRIPWVAAGGLVVARGELKVPVRTMDTAATALEALGIAIPANWAGNAVPCLRPEDAKALGRAA